MAKTPEGVVKAAIKKWLDANGFWKAGSSRPSVVRGWYWMPVPSAFSVHGIPDFVCIYRGHAFHIEAKKPGGGVLTANQEQRHLEIRAAGGTVVIVDDVIQLAGILEKMDAQSQGLRETAPD